MRTVRRLVNITRASRFSLLPLFAGEGGAKRRMRGLLLLASPCAADPRLSPARALQYAHKNRRASGIPLPASLRGGVRGGALAGSGRPKAVLLSLGEPHPQPLPVKNGEGRLRPSS